MHFEEAPKPAILLDIDGVILPTSNGLAYTHELYETDEVHTAAHSNEGLDRLILPTGEFYYPEIIKALAEVAINAPIIAATSRQTSFLREPYYGYLRKDLNIAGALHIDTYWPGRIDHKYDAVRRFTHGLYDTDLDVLEKGRGRILNQFGSDLTAPVGRVVWIDDHIAKLRYYGDDEAEAERLEDELLADTKITTISPHPKVGLTLEDVEAIRMAIN